jgi:uncharacterized protein GlcG (DUF336 family)
MIPVPRRFAALQFGHITPVSGQKSSPVSTGRRPCRVGGDAYLFNAHAGCNGDLERSRRTARPPVLTAVFMLAAGLWLSTSAVAGDLVTVKQMSLELAAELVHAAVAACRAQGWQVSAVAVDRTGVPQAMLRDTFASRFTIQIAEEKANAVILSGVASSQFRQNREDIRPEMDQVAGILVLEGGIPVHAAGSLVGAVGVSGAPGGDKDEACALAAVKTVQERLELDE